MLPSLRANLTHLLITHETLVHFWQFLSVSYQISSNLSWRQTHALCQWCHRFLLLFVQNLVELLDCLAIIYFEVELALPFYSTRSAAFYVFCFIKVNFRIVELLRTLDILKILLIRHFCF